MDCLDLNESGSDCNQRKQKIYVNIPVPPEILTSFSDISENIKRYSKLKNVYVTCQSVIPFESIAMSSIKKMKTVLPFISKLTFKYDEPYIIPDDYDDIKDLLESKHGRRIEFILPKEMYVISLSELYSYQYSEMEFDHREDNDIHFHVPSYIKKFTISRSMYSDEYSIEPNVPCKISMDLRKSFSLKHLILDAEIEEIIGGDMNIRHLEISRRFQGIQQFRNLKKLYLFGEDVIEESFPHLNSFPYLRELKIMYTKKPRDFSHLIGVETMSLSCEKNVYTTLPPNLKNFYFDFTTRQLKHIDFPFDYPKKLETVEITLSSPLKRKTQENDTKLLSKFIKTVDPPFPSVLKLLSFKTGESDAIIMERDLLPLSIKSIQLGSFVFIKNFQHPSCIIEDAEKSYIKVESSLQNDIQLLGIKIKDDSFIMKRRKNRSSVKLKTNAKANDLF